MNGMPIVVMARSPSEHAPRVFDQRELGNLASLHIRQLVSSRRPRIADRLYGPAPGQRRRRGHALVRECPRIDPDPSCGQPIQESAWVLFGLLTIPVLQSARSAHASFTSLCSIGGHVSRNELSADGGRHWPAATQSARTRGEEEFRRCRLQGP